MKSDVLEEHEPEEEELDQEAIADKEEKEKLEIIKQLIKME